MADPKASIIIRCYNEADHIGKLLHGVFQQTMEDFEVLVVDSGSTDGTLDIIEQYPVDEVVYIDPADFSFGAALNEGCREASGTFCVFASAHVYPRRHDWLERLLEKFEEDESLALVYGKQRGNGESKFSERQVFKRWFPNEDIDRQQSPFCNNANAAIRRELWTEYPYDEELTGLEDLDWAKRVQADGYEISYSSEAEIVHVHDETPREVYNRYRREALAHKRIMPEQEFTLGDFVKTFATNLVMDYWQAAKRGELRENVGSIPMFRFLQFFGTYRGFALDDSVSDQLRRRFYYPNQDELPERAQPEEDGRYIDYSELSD